MIASSLLDAEAMAILADMDKLKEKKKKKISIEGEGDALKKKRGWILRRQHQVLKLRLDSKGKPCCLDAF